VSGGEPVFAFYDPANDMVTAATLSGGTNYYAVGSWTQEFTAGDVLTFYSPANGGMLSAAYLGTGGPVLSYPVGDYIDEWTVNPAANSTQTPRDVLAFYSSSGVLTEANLGTSPTNPPHYYVGPWNEEWTGSSNTGSGMAANTNILAFYDGGSIVPVDLASGDPPASAFTVGTAAAPLPTSQSPLVSSEPSSAGAAATALGSPLSPSSTASASNETLLTSPPHEAAPPPAVPAEPTNLPITAYRLTQGFDSFKSGMDATNAYLAAEDKLLTNDLKKSKGAAVQIKTLRVETANLKRLSTFGSALSSIKVTTVISDLAESARDPDDASTQNHLNIDLNRLKVQLSTDAVVFSAAANAFLAVTGVRSGSNGIEAAFATARTETDVVWSTAAEAVESLAYSIGLSLTLINT
jgi:hypothetical protein